MEHLIPLATAAVQTVLFLLGVYAMVLRSDMASKALKESISEMKTELEKLAEVIVEQAVQTTRIDNMAEQITIVQRNIEDLRRGNGYITARDR